MLRSQKVRRRQRKDVDAASGLEQGRSRLLARHGAADAVTVHRVGLGLGRRDRDGTEKDRTESGSGLAKTETETEQQRIRRLSLGRRAEASDGV